MPSALPITLWPNKVDDLFELLEIHGGDDIRCHGTRKDGTKCQAKVSKASWSEIQKLLRIVIIKGEWETSETLLEEVSRLIMCKANHQGQGSGRLAQWRALLQPQPMSDPISSSDIVEDTTTAIKEEPDLEVKPLGSLKDVKEGQILIDVKPIDSTTHTVLEIPVKSVKIETEKTCHHFVPFSAPRATAWINNRIKEQVLKSLSLNERGAQNTGEVYIYTFPSLYRTRAPHLKIGHTKSVDKRMKDWKAQCQYEPKLLGTFTAEHYVKVERLVHKQLHNTRLKEPKCPGCNKEHIEWFKVRQNEASNAVGLWSDWTRQQPYDDEGELKEKWRKRLSKVDLEDPKCWESFVNGTGEDEEEEEDDDETEQEYLSEDGTFEESDFEDDSEPDEQMSRCQL